MSSFMFRLASYNYRSLLERILFNSDSSMNEEKPFKILKLPFLALRNVIDQMKLREVIELSKVSANAKCAVKKTDRKIYKLLINNMPSRVTVIENIKDLAHPIQYTKKMHTKKYPDVLCTSNTNYCILYYCIYSKEQKFTTLTYYEPDELMDILDTFNELFSVQSLDLTIKHDELFGEYLCTLSHPMFDKCFYVEIFGEQTFTTRNMRALMKMVELKRKLIIYCFIDEKFNRELMFNVPELKVVHSSKFTLKDLTFSNCKVIKLWNHSFNEKDINNLIRCWLDGKMPKLRRLRLFGRMNPKMYEQILEGIETCIWDGKRRPKMYIHEIEHLDCETGRDIVRNDGNVATLLLVHQSLDFIVWND